MKTTFNIKVYFILAFIIFANYSMKAKETTDEITPNTINNAPNNVNYSNFKNSGMIAVQSESESLYIGEVTTLEDNQLWMCVDLRSNEHMTLQEQIVIIFKVSNNDL